MNHQTQLNFWEEQIWKVHSIFTIFSALILYHSFKDESRDINLTLIMLSFGFLILLYCLTAIFIMDRKRLYHIKKIDSNDKSRGFVRIGVWGDIFVCLFLVPIYFFAFLNFGKTAGLVWFLSILMIWTYFVIITSIILNNQNI